MRRLETISKRRGFERDPMRKINGKLLPISNPLNTIQCTRNTFPRKCLQLYFRQPVLKVFVETHASKASLVRAFIYFVSCDIVLIIDLVERLDDLWRKSFIG